MNNIGKWNPKRLLLKSSYHTQQEQIQAAYKLEAYHTLASGTRRISLMWFDFSPHSWPDIYSR